MAIVKMQRVSIFGLNKDRESILERLQRWRNRCPDGR